MGGNPVNLNDPNGLAARAVSNVASATATYFNNDPMGAMASFGTGLAVGAGVTALTAACPVCGLAAGGALLAGGAYDLGKNDFSNARALGSAFQSVASGNASPNQTAMVGSTVLGAAGGIAGGGIGSSFSSAGRSGAAESAVNPNVLSGHGGLIVGNSSPVTVVPQGTSITFWTQHGNTISDALGNAIETGGKITLDQFPEAAGARTYLSGSVVPNYTLYPPTGLNIMGTPTTVTTPTNLGAILQPGMGNVNWAACCSVVSH